MSTELESPSPLAATEPLALETLTDRLLDIGFENPLFPTSPTAVRELRDKRNQFKTGLLSILSESDVSLSKISEADMSMRAKLIYPVTLGMPPHQAAREFVAELRRHLENPAFGDPEVTKENN